MPRYYDALDDDEDDLEENPYAESDTDADDEDVEVYENPDDVKRLPNIISFKEYEALAPEQQKLYFKLPSIGAFGLRSAFKVNPKGRMLLRAQGVRTLEDERLLQYAKAEAADHGRAKDWPYIMELFYRMKMRRNPDDGDVMENPASVVRTARDERLWRMAKSSAARQGRAREWPYIMGIFQRMKHHEGGATMNPDDGDKPRENPKVKWQKYGTKGVHWEGEWLVTVDGQQFRAWYDGGVGALGGWYFVPASDTKTLISEAVRRHGPVQFGGWSREECVEAMQTAAREAALEAAIEAALADDDDEP